ncbi:MULTISPECIES: hypothetical protein [Methylosinus]|uniref:Uncharacterized protein n=1 Tax=Methylosinus trichosporium (strain ATCC 35070 / NCIMB 11131 / UNIQEM 75 / OB3b) TaxID=595536 RepID=A0A2D2D3K6_METT3|nr:MULTISPECIES: hypothetical protein [Methylosinus]ATQ69578.1 hypothetical protein CQW49_18100 [Methylosinus trichosporium OB3b]OBS53919.1 hypothetical protein A8B73_03390 [Methylosinus sp. 3S-1]
MTNFAQPTCLAVLVALCAQIGADSASAKTRARRCVCPEKTVEKTETEQPCETRTVYRRVVERRTVYVEPAAVVAAPVYVGYPGYAYGAGYYGSYGYPYGYAYGGSGIVDAGFGAYGIGWGGWGW